MTHVIALLRAVNVGGNGKVPMAELTKVLTKRGYTGVKTLLNSGNVVFACAEKSDAKLETALEAAVAEAVGVTTDFYVRTAAEWDAIIAKNPYPAEAVNDPGHLLVMTFKAAPSAANVKALQAAIVGRETIHAIGKQLYIVYPDGVGTSKLTNAIIDRHLGAKGTARNWNTVLKLAAAAAALP
jgi:uncharacterized protein (DUF1697 family)